MNYSSKVCSHLLRIVHLLTLVALWLNPLLPILEAPSAQVAHAEASQPGTLTNRANSNQDMTIVDLAIDSTPASSNILGTPAAPLPNNGLVSAGLRDSSLTFIENIGQFDARERYQVRRGNTTLHVADDGLWFTILQNPDASALLQRNIPKPKLDSTPARGLNIRFSFDGANPAAQLVRFNRLDTRVSLFRENDPNHWFADVPTWGGIRYLNLYPGLDLELEGDKGAWLPKMIVHPGADITNVRMRITGAESLSIKTSSSLEISTTLGIFDWPLLRLVNEDETPSTIGRQLPSVDGSVIIQPFIRPTTSQLESGPNPQLPSASKPLLHTVSLVSESAGTNSDAIAVSQRGADKNNIFNSHETSKTSSATADLNSSTVITPTDSSFYSSFLGGGGDDVGSGRFGPSGAMYIAGRTASSNFPTSTGAFSTTFGGGFTPYDAFVTKFNADGTLAYSTYLGSSYDDGASDIAVDADGNAYVVGYTEGCLFPVTAGAYQTTCGSGTNAFVTKLNSTGTGLLYSTYLSGGGSDNAYGVATSEGKYAFVTGQTLSSDFPTKSAYQSTLNGSSDAFVAKIDTSASGNSSLIYSTYLGGVNEDSGARVAINGSGEAYVVGSSIASFPTGQVDYRSQTGNRDAFVAKLSSSGSSLLYSALFGSRTLHNGLFYDQGNDDATGIAVDANGMAYVTGHGTGGLSGYPYFDIYSFVATAGVYQPTGTVGDTAFVTKIDTSVASPLYFTHLGGNSLDAGFGIDVDGSGNAFVTGETLSSDFPTSGNLALDSTCGTNGSCNNGEPDAFIVALNPSGSALLYGTYFGGSDVEIPSSIDWETNGAILVVGYTGSSDYPTSLNAYQSTYRGCSPTPAHQCEAFFFRSTPTLATILPDSFVRNGLCLDCIISPALRGAIGLIGKPINTRTGSEDYTATDLSFPALGGPMLFQRSYSSLATNIFTTTLGYGWSHNLNSQLTLPSAPGGVSGEVLLKLHSTNQFIFYDNGNATYTPYSGVTAQLISTTVPAPGYVVSTTDQATYRFNPQGQLQSWSDAQGHTWTYTYTTGLLTQAADSTGQRYLNLLYDGNNRLKSVSDPLARSVGYGYDVHGDLSVVTDTRGFTWTLLYSGTTHLLSQIIDPLGQTVAKTDYDSQGRAIRQYDALNVRTLDLSYLPNGTTAYTDTLGRVMTNTYDGRGTLVNAQDANGQAIQKQFDANFRVSQLTDPNGHATQMTWGSGGANLTQATDALNNTTALQYDAYNNLTQTTDALGHTTTFVYSGTLLTRSTDALGNATLYTYTNGFLTTQSDARGNTTNYAYNAFGQRTSVTDAQANNSAYAYDGVGRLITTTDALGRMTVNAYDNADHPIRTTQNYTTASGLQNYLNQYNSVTQYGYDAVGRRTLVTDTVGRVTLNAYDPIGRLIQVTQNYITSPSTQNYLNQYNLITKYGFDKLGNPVLVTDTLGRVTRTDYDSVNRPVTMTVRYVDGTPGPGADEDVRTVTTYDAAGNPTRVTDVLGRVTQTGYDSLNRPVTVTTNYVDGIFDPLRPDEDLVSITGYDEVGNAITTTDALKRVTRNYFDALNRTISVTLNYTTAGSYDTGQYNLTTRYGFDKVGDQILMTDTLGRVTKTDYDNLNRVSQVTANYLVGQPQNYQGEYNIVTQYAYDAAGRRTVVTDTLGRVAKTDYDALNRTLTATANYTTAGSFDGSQYNVAMRNGYDALGNRIVMTDALGNATVMTYDVLNRVITTTQPLNQVTVAQYDVLGNRTAATDPRSNTTQYGYDALNRNTSVTPPGQPASSVTYDLAGRQTAQSDGLGHSISYGYDNADRQVSVSDPLANTTRYGYDAVGNRLVMTDANSVLTRYGYDAADRLANVTENSVSGGPSDFQTNLLTRYGYDALGNRLVITDVRGYTATFSYDTLNRLKTQKDALNNTSTYSYDAASRRTQQVDAKNQTTQYGYDALNRLASIGYLADGTSVAFGYDAVGNRLVMTDTVGVTRYQYDSLYRMQQVTDPFNQVIGYQYDSANNRTNLTYPDGKVVTSTYNALNLLSTVKDWASQTTSYGYDNANRLITTTLPNNVVSLNSYDNANRLTHLSHTQVVSSVTLADYQFGVDAVGNRTRITETVQSPAGGVIQPQRPSGAPFVGVPDVSHSLPDGADLNNVPNAKYQLYLPLVSGGNTKPNDNPGPKLGGSASNIVISEVRTRGPNGVNDEFLELFNPTDAGIAIGGWLVRGSSANGQVSTRATISTGVTLQAGQHYLVAHTGFSGSVTPDQTYTSDVPDAGGFAIVTGTTIIDQVGFGTKSAYLEGTPLTALATNTNQSYARNGGGCTDSNNNAADFTLINPSAPQNKASPITPCSPTTTSTVLKYAYDPVYRLMSGIYSGTTVYTFAYGYDGVGNRLVQTRTITSTQAISYTYDNANRLTNVGGQAYTWDANGNLLNDGTSLYAYDPANRLKTLTQTATVYSFAYNGTGDRLKQTIAGTLTTYTLDLNTGLTQVLADSGSRYVYGNARITQYAGASASYFLPDGLGSVRQLADNTGLVTLAERYDPFGGLLTSAGSGVSAFGFAGEQTDLTGLEYLRARYYATGVGRFIAKDTWEGDYIKPQSYNAWLYTYANPVNLTDPSGNIPPPEAIHTMIQTKFVFTHRSHIIVPEFRVELASKDGQVLVTAGQFGQPGFIAKLGGPAPNREGYIDIVDVTTAEAYEIKHENDFINGIAEIEWYLIKYNSNPQAHRIGDPALLKKGSDFTLPPAWDLVGPNPYDPSGTDYIVAQLKTSGVIVYKGVRPTEVPVLVPIPFPKEVWQWNPETKKAERKPFGWNPLPAPAPAFCLPTFDPETVKAVTAIGEGIVTAGLILRGLTRYVLSPSY